MNESISDGGDCRTAPATPGLLTTFYITSLCRGLANFLLLQCFFGVPDWYHMVYQKEAW